MRRVVRPIALSLVHALVSTSVCFAAVGLAEWEIRTPGGHLISHIDPLKEGHGTCLRKADATPGVVYGRPEDVYVSHIEWWTYYPDHVVGKGRQGHFIFNERTAAVELYASERAMAESIRTRGRGAPLSRRLTAEDGWNETWLPVYREQCRKLRTDSPEFGGLSEAQKKGMKDLCARLGVN